MISMTWPRSVKSCRFLQSRPTKPARRFRRIQVCPKDLSIRLVSGLVCEGGGPIALLRQGEFSDIMWVALYSILVPPSHASVDIVLA